MRKQHGSVPKIHTCSGPDSHNEQKTGIQGAITDGTPVPPPRYEQPHTIGGPAEQQKTDERLAVARSSSGDDDDFCSGGPNNSSDDLRADAAAMRPSPMPSLKRQGRAEGRRVGGQSVGGTGYLVGGGTSSSCRGGRRRRERLQSQARGNCQRHERRTPFPPITEGRSGLPPAQGPTPTRHTPLPSTDDENP
jgi:hypothetical protein